MTKSDECPQITCVRATGAMYAMLQIHVDQLEDSISNDKDFAGQLLQEENIFMLPGSCFGMPNFLRMVTCPPKVSVPNTCDRHPHRNHHHHHYRNRHHHPSHNLLPTFLCSTITTTITTTTTATPQARLEEAFDRINAFCQRHLAPADKKAKV
jgi:hypothetical protein